MSHAGVGIRRGVGVIVCAAFLSGCALPPSVQALSWAIDGISFLMTDKTIADHGLSALASKDCALWRGVKGEQFCSEYDDSVSVAVVAVAAPAGVDVPGAAHAEWGEAVKNLKSTPALADQRAGPLSSQESRSSKVEKKRIMMGRRVWSEHQDADLYYVIGMFSDQARARRLVKEQGHLGPAVMTFTADGARVYRVAVGPFAEGQERMVGAALEKSKISTMWTMRIDQKDWTPASHEEVLGSARSIAKVPVTPEEADLNS